MKHILNIILACSFLILSGCSQSKEEKPAKSIYTSKIVSVSNNQFGYDIYKDSVMIIHQPIIPSVAGNNGFESETDAKKIADLMIHKLDKGIMPPSVSAKELDSLSVAIPRRFN